MCYRCDHSFQDRAFQRMRNRRLSPEQVMAWMLRHVGLMPMLASMISTGAMLDSRYCRRESVRVRVDGIPVSYSLS